MNEYRIIFEYVYSFISFGEELETAVRTEEFPIGGRFRLDGQEDGSFTVGGIESDGTGNFAVLTFPNKDRLIVREGRCTELEYDEFFESMGDSNHNVYVGAVRLEKR